MDNIKFIISVCIFILGFISSLISLIIKNVKNVRVKTKLQDILDITNELLPLIQEAETFLNYSGEEKKQYVLSRILQISYQKGIDIDKTVLENKIDELVEFTNEVNSNKLRKSSKLI